MENVAKQFKIAAIGSEPLALGFRLAGVTESYVVEKQDEAEAAIRKLLEGGDVGIIVVTSRIVNAIKDRRLYDTIMNSTLPLFMLVADYKDDMTAEEDTLRQLIIRALGIDIGKAV